MILKDSSAGNAGNTLAGVSGHYEFTVARVPTNSEIHFAR